MLQEYKQHIISQFPFLLESRILIAVSGGVDSMVLLHLLQQLNLNCSVVHCNFNLRGTESDLDEEFIRDYCIQKAIPCYVKSFDTIFYADKHKISIQMAARELRYQWFHELEKKHQFKYILTAHHLDDQVETFLINFIRGTGIEGLLGIPEVNDTIIRTLLCFSREQILNFANEQNIKWREDSSNASDKYFRNKLRHQVIPVLKELNPSFLKSFQSTIARLKQSENAVVECSKKTLDKLIQVNNNQIFIKISELKKLENYTFYLYQWLKEFGFSAWNDIYALVDGQSGKQIFSQTHVLLKNRDALILVEKSSSEHDTLFVLKNIEEELKFPLKLTLCNDSYIQEQNKSIIFVDADKIEFPLIVRKWREGDVFYPLGMKGSKKVSKFFKDEKISIFDKQKIWILESNNKIVWIIDYRQDDRFKVEQTTQTTLKIEFLK